MPDRRADSKRGQDLQACSAATDHPEINPRGFMQPAGRVACAGRPGAITTGLPPTYRCRHPYPRHTHLLAVPMNPIQPGTPAASYRNTTNRYRASDDQTHYPGCGSCMMECLPPVRRQLQPDTSQYQGKCQKHKGSTQSRPAFASKHRLISAVIVDYFRCLHAVLPRTVHNNTILYF